MVLILISSSAPRKSKERHERRKMISRLATKRYKARMKAKEKGLPVDPKDAIRKGK